MRVILYVEDGAIRCINFDNDEDADRHMSEVAHARDLSEDEILTIFGEYAGYAGDEYTVITGTDLDTCTVSRTHPTPTLEDMLQLLDQQSEEVRNAGMEIRVLNSESNLAYKYHVQTDKASLGMMAAYTTETVVNGLVDVEWELGDKTFMTFVVQDFKQLFKIVTKYTRDCYARKKALKEALESSQEPHTIDVTVGWPTRIGSYTGTGL